jgi:hypothetical protein
MKRKSNNFSARVELRIDSAQKKSLIQFCKAQKISPSVVIRRALHQYISLGNFTSQLFEFLHTYPEAKYHFEKFLNFKHANSPHKVGVWFDTLLGTEEKNMVKNTPYALLNSLKDVLLTVSGKEALEERISNGGN